MSRLEPIPVLKDLLMQPADLLLYAVVVGRRERGGQQASNPTLQTRSRVRTIQMQAFNFVSKQPL